jgi:hypothetical protein
VSEKSKREKKKRVGKGAAEKWHGEQKIFSLFELLLRPTFSASLKKCGSKGSKSENIFT